MLSVEREFGTSFPGLKNREREALKLLYTQRFRDCSCCTVRNFLVLYVISMPCLPFLVAHNLSFRRALEAADQADSLADSSEEVVGSSGQLFLASATGSTSTTGSSSSGKGRALRPPASPLSCLGARLPARWASSARAKLLAQARVRMLAADYHNSVPSSDALSLSGCLGSGNDSASSSPLAFPTCQVFHIVSSSSFASFSSFPLNKIWNMD